MDISGRMTQNKLYEFSHDLKDLSREIGFRVSSRGWAYLLETRRLIDKNDFDKITNIINKCRRVGFLPIDFVAEESAREFKGVEIPSTESVIDDFAAWLDAAKKTAEYYHVDWWKDEEYYIQIVVEKIDLVTLFYPICSQYHIPIANSKGWSSMLQRAEYAKRFREAELDGKKCVLLYCGDHDPDGLRISEFIRKNLDDLKNIKWSFGSAGYNPVNLEINRFGLNDDFIEEHNLTWINNLITGSGSNLASPSHKNYNMEYVQKYLSIFGENKCEANAIVTMPKEAKALVESAITNYLGTDALERFEKKHQLIRDEFETFLNESGLEKSIDDALEIIRNR